MRLPHDIKASVPGTGLINVVASTIFALGGANQPPVLQIYLLLSAQPQVRGAVLRMVSENYRVTIVKPPGDNDSLTDLPANKVRREPRSPSVNDIRGALGRDRLVWAWISADPADPIGHPVLVYGRPETKDSFLVYSPEAAFETLLTYSPRRLRNEMRLQQGIVIVWYDRRHRLRR